MWSDEVNYQPDLQRVENSAETNALFQRDPQRKHSKPNDVHHQAEFCMEPFGKTLVQHVPRGRAHLGLHQQSDANAENGKADDAAWQTLAQICSRQWLLAQCPQQ